MNELSLALSIPAFLTCLSGTSVAQDKPNIVVVSMDNFGWGEPGFNGGGIMRGAPTPRLDTLASEGLVESIQFVSPNVAVEDVRMLQNAAAAREEVEHQQTPGQLDSSERSSRRELHRRVKATRESRPPRRWRRSAES